MITKSDITFYIIQHINVLGMEKGVEQVANRLAFNKDSVRDIYRNRKADQMAV
ncbi:hypothetical protein [Salibacterium qingdaonense]|uniref:Transposase n=1 Tax=Salibacterium qingdaonense TaxID=266892 RepID=A0A1I4QW41_9BACI|nr:hypothetical protein [Salibacterium qingdaonense]SFM44302.1 hypothetical protein SAMN04488054_15117 [Salibacterium qingdaonense]